MSTSRSGVSYFFVILVIFLPTGFGTTECRWTTENRSIVFELLFNDLFVTSQYDQSYYDIYSFF